MPVTVHAALTIAGSDPSGGAGIQADLKTFHRFGVYGQAVITLVTVQNTTDLRRVHVLDAGLIAEQIQAVLSDFPPCAAKTGALGSAAIVKAVAAADFPCPLIVDPVMVSKRGAPLLDDDGVRALRRELLPRAFLVMPNLDEAALLAGSPVETPQQIREAARAIAGLGPENVLIKGGHLAGDAVDTLLSGGHFTEFRAPRIATRHTHGTGCTYSAAIVAGIADGLDLRAAVLRAKAFITSAIETNPGFGRGAGPVNHWA